ncbi:unnamed protein product, partial [Ectocarpus fasciculatus]
MIGGGFGGFEVRSGSNGAGRLGGVSVNSSSAGGGHHLSPVAMVGGGSRQWNAEATEVHLTGLRDDGKVGNGIRRVGSKGSYRAMMSRSPRA